MLEDNGFLFLSHAFLDKEEVRKIRNMLEEKDFEPICFFLKCLTDHDEIRGLIKREISAREWFVCVDSKNARKSKWVLDECRHRLSDRGVDVEGMDSQSLWNLIYDDENILVADLESDMSVDEIVDVLVRGLRVNVIHDLRDMDFAAKLIEKLKEKDFQVTSDSDMELGKSYLDQLGQNIERASRSGSNIVVISRNSIHSGVVEDEVEHAFSTDSLIFLVFIDDVELEGSLKFYLGAAQYIFSEKFIRDEEDLDTFAEYVVDVIRSELNGKFS